MDRIGRSGSPEYAVDAHGTRDATRRPALAMQRHRLIEPVTSDGVPVRGRELSYRCRGYVRRRLRVLNFLHSRGRCRVQIAVMPIEHPGQGVAKVAQEVEAVRDLDSLGCAVPNAIGVGAGAVARDDLDAGMAVQPCPDRLRVAVRQHVDRTVALQIDDQRAVALPSAPRPIVDADDVWRRHRGQWRRSDQAQKRVAADRHGQARCQAGAGLASCAEGDVALSLGKTGGSPHPRQGCRQALGKNAARALGSRAPETSDLQVELADTALPRQITEAAEVSAVDTARRTLAKGTRSNRAPGMDGNDDAVRSNRALIDDEADRKQGQQRLGQRTGSTPSEMASPLYDHCRPPAQHNCTENAEGPVPDVA